MPLNAKASTLMSRIRFASTSDILEVQGVIQHKDDLAKLIEQTRLSAAAVA